ncbi:MAG: bifunctional DNA-formamidopyrimidine glycosylase/DNA-(apurinic or apyrimidinic site) lyase [Victivallales bacterium]|nr:bifunctional DNA-formamidopyrimidine glycosylase/DNA-(apurinic or apyrimidinic site) lyase [Victivallales bacterium]
MNHLLPGRSIQRVIVRTQKLRTSLAPLEVARLQNRRFTAVYRRGRYIILALDDRRGLLLHLGMTGAVSVTPADEPPRKHEHVILELDDGTAFRFEDPRRFGLLECHPLNGKGLPPALDFLGPEPMTDDFSGQAFHCAAHHHHIAVKELLMDNTVVTGIGNIYATESLFAAGIRPTRRADRLGRAACDRIVAEVKAVLARAIAAGGTTISDFRGVDGSEGSFNRELLIYGKAGTPCPRCDTLLRTVTLGGRSSCYCPKCQK